MVVMQGDSGSPTGRKCALCMVNGGSVYSESLAKKSEGKKMPQYKFIIQTTVFTVQFKVILAWLCE